MKKKSLPFYAAVLLLASLASCSTAPSVDYSKVGLVDVSGTVTLDGNPVPAAVVIFEAPDSQFSYAETDADGQYTLQFDSRGKMGVTPGPKVVRISTTRKIIGLNTDDESGGGEMPPGEAGGEGESAAAPSLELVPEKYNRNSALKVEVKPDDSQTFDFDLEST